ncbi:MAG: ribosome-binding factor [Myxococcaceae bacterium]|jgi:ribosome-binding factor A|nr:ribosome-binding factor [Myxococcaceae bacterium]
MAEIKRATRVAEGLREEVAMLLVKKLRDPRVQGAVVARVEMTDDLRNAKIYVRLLEGGDAERQKDLLIGLDRAAGMIRTEATRNLRLRVAPELKFFYDDGQDARTRVEELLEEVRKDDKRTKSPG